MSDKARRLFEQRKRRRNRKPKTNTKSPLRDPDYDQEIPMQQFVKIKKFKYFNDEWNEED